MKTLRVLAGLHAGARLALAPGLYRVGSSAISDALSTPDATPIELLDWTEPMLSIAVDAAGRVIVLPSGDEATGQASQAAAGDAWADLVPRRFGDVVLCVGASDQPWPDDAQLVALLNKPVVGESSAPATRRASWGMRAGFIGAGLLAAVSALYGRSDAPTHQTPPARPEQAAQLLKQSLESRGFKELQVREERDAVILAGLVPDANAGRSVRSATLEVERTSGVPVVMQWEVADDIASTIEAALRLPGVHARYVGAGRFEIEGIVADPAAVRESAGPLTKDLGANVKGINFSLERRHRAAAPFSSAIVADALRYSERPDGAKVFQDNTAIAR
ncbi:hypothetical protein [Xylophilus sp. GOD-11R]|uniref:hypothetical protein n=1 Tax=Xylophilus sp. GOD-11R TaxID=3089814 RepID=UPI00298CC1ED|nr:hypothetical protein [Xylophilus sp. GOD-11R]WPB57934.1 hypothetical protein R9X41_04620 [Xylophilus sp. GOD-11R]